MVVKLSEDFVDVSVSTGTLKTDDLIDLFVDFIVEHDEDALNDLLNEFPEFLELASTQEYVEKMPEEAVELLEMLFELLDEMAPKDCVFGIHEGDGLDIGFWLVNEADLNRVVFGTSWCWWDIVGLLGKLEGVFLNQSEDKKKELIEKYSHSIGKGMEWGIMEYWTDVLCSAIDNSGLIEELTDLEKNDSEIK